MELNLLLWEFSNPIQIAKVLYHTAGKGYVICLKTYWQYDIQDNRSRQLVMENRPDAVSLYQRITKLVL